MSTGYYEYAADFECDDVEEYIFPSDIKRIISHGDHTFHNRIYFFSPSERRVYRYLSIPVPIGEFLSPYRIHRSLKYNMMVSL